MPIKTMRSSERNRKTLNCTSLCVGECGFSIASPSVNRLLVVSVRVFSASDVIKSVRVCKWLVGRQWPSKMAIRVSKNSRIQSIWPQTRKHQMPCPTIQPLNTTYLVDNLLVCRALFLSFSFSVCFA